MGIPNTLPEQQGDPGGESLVISPSRPCEDELVRQWRQARCERMGYEEAAASALAFDLTVDLHLLERLLAAGCSHELARRIV